LRKRALGLIREMAEDARVIVLGEDVGRCGGAFGATRGLWQRFGGDRVRDTAVSEQAIVGCSVGAAMTGLRPVAELQYSDFVTIAMDQLVNQAAKIRYMFGGVQGVPLVIRAPVGGYLSEAAQHSQSLEAWFVHVAGLKVISPSTPYDAKGLLIAAIECDDPVVFFEHKKLYGAKGEVPEDRYTVPIGKAEVKRKGRDLTIISYSYAVSLCLQAADRLADDGIEATVVDMRTLSPMDTRTIVEESSRTGRVMVVHEANRRCGVGAEISAVVCEACFASLKAPVLRVAAHGVPIPYSPVLQQAVLPQIDDVVDGGRRLVS
jgi:pyruvate/2-oxoglutarate/acetoin dehydrogenase E1 component